MTPMQDATPNPLPKLPTEMEASMTWPIQGHSRPSPASSLSSLPYRTSNPSLHRLFESTASISTSRPSSGSATPTASTAPGATLSPRQSGIGTPGSLRNLPPGVSDEYRTLVQRAFVPHVAVLADEETEELIRGKGLEGGLLQLLRPYGESVPGKVTIRDSNGAGRSYDDFGVRFVGVNDGLGIPTMPGRSPGLQVDTSNGQRTSSSTARPRRTGGDVAQVEELVDRHLQFSEFNTQGMGGDYVNPDDQGGQPDSSNSPFYTLYLRRLLSGLPVVPHETFAHPVAGIIAISSRNTHPIEELRRLYNRQHDGDLRFPQWVENDFLRYYVLVHDEETGDIAKSNQTFDSMKRHFGLHCHLLRLKSQQIIPSDDDSVRLPTCEWMSATEELAEIRKRETTDDITDPTPYLPESDVTAVKTFVRELVAQSVIPNMERAVATWNEQVLARRRGISGRFMSLSKRWTPFGSSRSSTSISSSSSSNYDSLQGFYRPDAPEAQMRKLADYCFMLRDWKLALSTYDILRTDFNNDKAWRHYAGAAEMAAMSALMMTGPISTSKARTENLDSLIEAASYSYTDRQRSAAPYYALRTLALGVELLRLRGASAAEDAARWGSKILDTGLVGAIGHALIAERVSACYAIRTGVGIYKVGSRRRKAALWAVLASEYWWRLDKALQAEKCLENALRLYGTLTEDGKGAAVALPFPDMQAFIDELRQQILGLRLTNRAMNREDGDDDEALQHQQSLVVEEATETLDKSPRVHRKSLIGATAPPIDVGPLSPRLERNKDEAEKKDDQFE